MQEITYHIFIQNILNTRGRFDCGDEYHERHHIIPKCMGGTNDEENLIDLFPREHFIAHKLLAQENPNIEGLVYAWWCMSNMSGEYIKGVKRLTPEEYEDAKKAYRKLITGKPFSEEHRRKISEATKGKTISEKTRLAVAKANSNRIWSENSRRKMSKSMSGENHPRFGTHWSEEGKRKLSDALKGIGVGEDNPRASIILQYDKNGNLIKIWRYIKLASKELKINASDISACAKGRLKSAGGYCWKYLYDNTYKNEIVLGAISLGLITEENALKRLNDS